MNTTLRKFSWLFQCSKRIRNSKVFLPQYRYLHNTLEHSRLSSFDNKNSGIFTICLCNKKWFGSKSTPENESFPKEKPAVKDDLIQSDVPVEKLGLFARFKLMYKQYWYVLIPVHVITSVGWLGGFYYLSKSGVDIASLLQALQISESVIDKVKGSDMGHLAIAYLCYKIATPARYMVTLGGTTISIKYLEQAGYIKPMPTKSQLIQMYEDKKADLVKYRQDRVDRNEKSRDNK